MWYCGGKGTGFGGAMFDCQEITSFKLEMRFSRTWLATSILELNSLLKMRHDVTDGY